MLHAASKPEQLNSTTTKADNGKTDRYGVLTIRVLSNNLRSPIAVLLIGQPVQMQYELGSLMRRLRCCLGSKKQTNYPNGPPVRRVTQNMWVKYCMRALISTAASGVRWKKKGKKLTSQRRREKGHGGGAKVIRHAVSSGTMRASDAALARILRLGMRMPNSRGCKECDSTVRAGVRSHVM